MSASKYILILLLLFPSVAYGAVITIDTNMSADATIAGFNNNFSILSDWANGDVEGSAVNSATTNILADSIGELDMGDDANPRVRDSELFTITTDSSSGGTLTQNTYVPDGLVFTDDGSGYDASWTAGTAYVNGYRVYKAAGTFNDSSTPAFTNNKDNYIDLEQDGDWHISLVDNGLTAPGVFANSARIAMVKVTAADVVSATDLARRRLSTLVIPSNYRDGLIVSRDSATTVHIDLGDAELNDTMVEKTIATTLTITTDTDWADDGAPTAPAYGYVGIDADGTIQLLELAPTHSNYALSRVTGIKRYVQDPVTTGEVYRVIGWFYIGTLTQIYASEIGNIREHGIPNFCVSADAVSATVSNLAYDTSEKLRVTIHFYSTGRPISATLGSFWTESSNGPQTVISLDSVASDAGSFGSQAGNTDGAGTLIKSHYTSNYANSNVQQGTHTVEGKFRVNAGTDDIASYIFTVREE